MSCENKAGEGVVHCVPVDGMSPPKSPSIGCEIPTTSWLETPEGRFALKERVRIERELAREYFAGKIRHASPAKTIELFNEQRALGLL